VSVDFFTVPTSRFQVLYVFLVLAHERRRIVHFAVTAHPTAEWTAQQMREAFPWESAPRRSPATTCNGSSTWPALNPASGATAESVKSFPRAQVWKVLSILYSSLNTP
jgi:hypothetical protein